MYPALAKSHVAQGIGHAAIQQGHKVLYRGADVAREKKGRRPSIP
jgi:hypothetical protein